MDLCDARNRPPKQAQESASWNRAGQMGYGRLKYHHNHNHHDYDDDDNEMMALKMMKIITCIIAVVLIKTLLSIMR